MARATERYPTDMMPRAAVARLAKATGQALAAGGAQDQGARAAIAMLAEAGAAPAIVGCLLAECRRKRPSDTAVEGCLFLLTGALEQLRFAANGGERAAAEAIEEVRQEVERALATADLEPGVLMLMARAFTQAGLDPGPALQQSLVTALESQGEAQPAGMEPADLAAAFDEVAAQLGDDPFDIHAELASSAAAFPTAQRAAMLQALILSSSEAVRQAALGFALAAEPEIATGVLAALADTPRDAAVPSVTVERLVRMRPWLQGARQTQLDAALRVLRPRAATPVPVSGAEIQRVLASPCDGTGAQSLFALARQGRRFAMACLLVKTTAGIGDAWVRTGMSKREAEAMVREIEGAAEAVGISVALLRRRLADALAINLARDLPPPFGLLQVVELLGLGPLHPQAEPPAALAEALLADLPPERTGPDAERAADRASPGWTQRFATLESWFEAGDAVEELLQPLRTRKQRIEAVIAQILPARRGFWCECCAWMAAILKEGAAPGNESWRDFALVARGLCGDRPLATMPLARTIATATVDAFARR